VGIILHSIGGPECVDGAVTFRPIPRREDDADFWQQMLLRAPVADAHFVIGRSGTVRPVIPPTEIANHAVGVNDVTIGIEMVNRGDGIEPYPGEQIEALVGLIRKVRSDFPKITIENIARHSDLDQRTCKCGNTTYARRQDPSGAFPYEDVLQKIKRPSDELKQTNLPRLTGPASQAACGRS
jgi:N-acetyl-anhydromuramyl-L-alanine amidase AmpD